MRRSTDNTETWGAAIVIEAGPSAGYSCLVNGALIGSDSQGAARLPLVALLVARHQGFATLCSVWELYYARILRISRNKSGPRITDYVVWIAQAVGGILFESLATGSISFATFPAVF